MKIVTKDAVYIEPGDIHFMIHNLNIIPFSVIKAIDNNNVNTYSKTSNNFIKITVIYSRLFFR